MKPESHLRGRWAGLLVLALAAAASHPQTVPDPLPVHATQPNAAESVLRDLVDLSLGAHWQLSRDARHPGGPGRLVLAAGTAPLTARPGIPSPGTPTPSPSPEPAAPIIRTGDRIILERHEGPVDSWLEGVALTPAKLGARLRARLRIGGRVVTAIASGRGRALFAGSGTEAHP
ncbi:hypothetical protein DYQ86_01830 [Acidobacteria bacterium AB60]|nr:hypothetical protein DYQ86_01830 [Acidobacteria bacterium AB60]